MTRHNRSPRGAAPSGPNEDWDFSDVGPDDPASGDSSAYDELFTSGDYVGHVGALFALPSRRDRMERQRKGRKGRSRNARSRR